MKINIRYDKNFFTDIRKELKKIDPRLSANGIQSPKIIEAKICFDTLLDGVTMYGRESVGTDHRQFVSAACTDSLKEAVMRSDVISFLKSKGFKCDGRWEAVQYEDDYIDQDFLRHQISFKKS